MWVVQSIGKSIAGGGLGEKVNFREIVRWLGGVAEAG
jgi:hypothetical protein